MMLSNQIILSVSLSLSLTIYSNLCVSQNHIQLF